MDTDFHRNASKKTLSNTIIDQPTKTWYDSAVTSNYKLRRLRDKFVKSFTIVCVVAVLYPLSSMLYMFVYKGATLISLSTITQPTIGSSSFVSGGLANAIEGTLLLLGIGSSVAVCLGVMGGVYIAEFSRNSRLAKGIRFGVDVLAGVPSIVLGYVGFLLLVIYFGWGYSALAGGLTLSVFMFPYIIRTTELALRKVPDEVREAAKALGSNNATVVNRLTLRFALPGIITGILLAISIGLGETAPLLYTASFSNYVPSALLQSPVGYLTYVVYVFSQLPSAEAHSLAYQASFLLIAIIVTLNFAARVLVQRFSKVT